MKRISMKDKSYNTLSRNQKIAIVIVLISGYISIKFSNVIFTQIVVGVFLGFDILKAIIKMLWTETEDIEERKRMLNQAGKKMAYFTLIMILLNTYRNVIPTLFDN